MLLKLGSYLLLLIVTTMVVPACADEFKAKVISVHDGDSLIVLRDNTARENVMLYGIDCPELGQDYGTQARQFTDQCCYGKAVIIDERGRDKLGRTIGIVYLPDGSNLNQELVRRGLAWWSDKYAPDDQTLKQYQELARANKIGLWSAPQPIPPWIFRNGARSVHAVIKGSQP